MLALATAGNVLRLLPPLNVSQQEIDQALKLIGEACAELHDEMGQCLTAIQADAESIRDVSPEKINRAIASADAILKVSAHIYEVVHSMMRRLRPSVLDNLGLEEALKEEINSWHKSWTTLIDYFYDGRLLGLSEQRQTILEGGSPSLIGKIAEKFYSRVISSMVTGIKTRSKLNQSLRS